MQSAPPRRFSPTTLAFGAVGLVVVVVVALVIVKVTGGGSSSSPNAIAPVLTSATPTVMSELTNVSPTISNAVGVPSSSLVQAPSVWNGQTPLKFDGKPGGFAVLAEFCPYCGAERWSLIVALSHFGTFSGVDETTSSPWDTDPATPTFSFLHATYTSPYFSMKLIENESNDTTGLGTRKPLQPLTSQETNLDNKASAHFGLSSQGYPFVDFGNKVFVLGPSYNPQVLDQTGLDQAALAAKLTNSKDQVTQAIVGSANYITAAICNLTGMQPASVCSESYVTQATKAMGL